MHCWLLVEHAFNPTTWQAEANRLLWIQGHLRLHGEFSLHNKTLSGKKGGGEGGKEERTTEHKEKMKKEISGSYVW